MTDAEADAPILWPLEEKSQLIGNDPDAGKDQGQEKWVIENELVGLMTNSMDRSLSKLQEIVNNRKAWCSTPHRVTKSWIYLMMKPTDLGSSSFSTLSFCLFILFIWFSRQEY